MPIKGATDPVVSGVACPRTPWGLAAMLREGLLAQMPSDVARQYRQEIDAFFSLSSQPTPEL
ncbi:hypothetical protein ACS5PN_09985 [Roseateles sp. NT4]|uniref:hypothetical protein n=1 Tax=Roseateles sp. NT4 TaxID=3453715 RepID=UPI003EEF6A9E